MDWILLLVLHDYIFSLLHFFFHEGESVRSISRQLSVVIVVVVEATSLDGNRDRAKKKLTFLKRPANILSFAFKWVFNINVNLNPLSIPDLPHFALILLRFGIQVLTLSGVIAKDAAHFSQRGVIAQHLICLLRAVEIGIGLVWQILHASLQLICKISVRLSYFIRFLDLQVISIQCRVISATASRALLRHVTDHGRRNRDILR